MKTRLLFLLMSILSASMAPCAAGVNDIYAYRDKATGLYGFCDYYGRIIVSPNFEDVDESSLVGKLNIKSDWAAVKKNGKWGFIDKNGKFESSYQYEDAHDFKNGFAPVKVNGKWGLIDIAGELIVLSQYDDIRRSGNSWWVMKDNKMGRINDNGRFIAQPQFDMFRDFQDGLAPIIHNGLYGYINIYGDIIIQPQFEDAWEFHEGLARVKRNNKWGYINNKGDFVIKPQFESAFNFTEHSAAVKINGKWGFIGKKGNFIIEPQYEYTEGFYEDLASVKFEKQFGVIDKKGKFVITPQSNIVIYKFKNGVAHVSVGGRSLAGIINHNGLYVILPEYDHIGHFSDDIAPAKKDGIEGYVDMSGNFYQSLPDALRAVHKR